MTKILDFDAFPVRWPEGWKRTPEFKRQTARYKLDFTRARDEVVRQLKLLGAREVILTTNVPLRIDGLPLAGQSEPKDPAVAVYWVEQGVWNVKSQAYDYKQWVVACDCWQKVRDNLRAVSVTIESLRTIKRAGATQALERAYSGFAVLPESTVSTKRAWRDVFGMRLAAHPSRTVLDALYRELARRRHPDVGGSHEAFVELQQAYEDAKAEIGS